MAPPFPIIAFTSCTARRWSACGAGPLAGGGFGGLVDAEAMGLDNTGRLVGHLGAPSLAFSVGHDGFPISCSTVRGPRG